MHMGGTSIVSPMRQASLRTMQKAVKRFLKEAHIPAGQIPALAPRMVMDFWKAVSIVASKEWSAPRAHMLTKGIGVYSLMSLAGILVREAREANRKCDLDYFITKLSDFICQIDWTNHSNIGDNATYTIFSKVTPPPDPVQPRTSCPRPSALLGCCWRRVGSKPICSVSVTSPSTDRNA